MKIFARVKESAKIKTNFSPSEKKKKKRKISPNEWQTKYTIVSYFMKIDIPTDRYTEQIVRNFYP